LHLALGLDISFHLQDPQAGPEFFKVKVHDRVDLGSSRIGDLLVGDCFEDFEICSVHFDHLEGYVGSSD
jgi:hypothetical protein